MIRATAMIEASRRNQIGQPAAWIMANNCFPVPFLALRGRSYRYGCGDFSQSVVPPQVSAVHQDVGHCSNPAVRCSRSRDIHKNLWISLWMSAEQRRSSHLRGPGSRLRSKNKQFFVELEQRLTQKNGAPRRTLSLADGIPAAVWISLRRFADTKDVRTATDFMKRPAKRSV